MKRLITAAALTLGALALTACQAEPTVSHSATASSVPAAASATTVVPVTQAVPTTQPVATTETVATTTPATTVPPTTQPVPSTAAAAPATPASATPVATARTSAAPRPPASTAISVGWLNAAVVQANVSRTICVSGWTSTVRPPTSYTEPIKLALLPAGHSASEYELDHIIPLELGGDPRDLRNLQLEPWTEAHAKDHEEDRLHDAVCSGAMTLAAAQAAMSAEGTSTQDTIAYAHVSAPVPTVASKPAPKPAPTTPKPVPTTAAPAPGPSAPPTTTARPAGNVVHAGAFCSTAGATGVTSTGNPMACTTTATDARLRWRSA